MEPQLLFKKSVSQAYCFGVYTDNLSSSAVGIYCEGSGQLMQCFMSRGAPVVVLTFFVAYYRDVPAEG